MNMNTNEDMYEYECMNMNAYEYFPVYMYYQMYTGRID